MATSGTSSFTMTRDEIIQEAAVNVGAARPGETMSHHMLSDFARKLNVMVKAWQGQGLHVWTTTEATLFPQSNQVRYALALNGADHATQSYVSTTLASAAAETDTTITVEDDDDITDGDNIGIKLSDGSLFWTTVDGAPAANVVTLDDALTGDAASDAAVFAYTTKIVRPLKIVDARTYDIASGNETPLSIMSRLDYQALPNKTQRGAVNQIFYDPQLTTGYLHLWLAQSDVVDLVNFTWHRPIQDFSAAGDNADLPQEWLQALIWNLSVVASVGFDVPDGKFARIKMLADESLAEMKGFDRDGDSIQFGVDME